MAGLESFSYPVADIKLNSLHYMYSDRIILGKMNMFIAGGGYGGE